MRRFDSDPRLQFLNEARYTIGGPLIDQVKSWLREQGYPLEMQTASAFRKAGFEVTQSSLYADHETGKSREIDVVAIHVDLLGATRIVFMVECKSSRKPWLLLSAPDVTAGHNRVRSFAVVDQNAIKAMFEDHIFDSLMKNCPWFRKEGDLIGYSLKSAFSESDIAFQATSSVAKACFAFVKGAKGYEQRVAFPVVVIPGPLIRCSLDDAGDILAEEVPQGEVFFKHDLENPWFCIRVVTLPALPEFVRQAYGVAGFLREQLRDSEKKLWEKHFSHPHPRSDEAELKSPKD